MSYATIDRCAHDSAFRARVAAAAADEGIPEPENAMLKLIWPISTADDIEAAYASAVAAENPDPGGDESVITDGMILSAVQANWPIAEPAP